MVRTNGIEFVMDIPLIEGHARIAFCDRKTNYILEIEEKAKQQKHLVTILAPYSQGQPLHVTAREIEEYQKSLPELKIEAGKQYVEVGTGLGALMPYIAETPGFLKPIAIDPIDYSSISNLLIHAMTRFDLYDHTNHRLFDLITRIDTITNPNKVKLYNMTLGQAIAKHPELVGSADVIVDLCGPMMYPLTETDGQDHSSAQFRVMTLEESLGKSGAKHYIR